MDALAYGLNLEIKANTGDLNREFEKSLSTANNYQKQIQNHSNTNIKDLRRMMDSHTSLNKILNEGLGIKQKMLNALGAISGLLRSMPRRFLGWLDGSGKALGILVGIPSFFHKIMKAYDDLTDKWRAASYQGAGGVRMLNKQVIQLTKSTGAYRVEAEAIIGVLVDSGFNAEASGEKFAVAAEQIQFFERTTRVAAETTAGYLKVMDGLGVSQEKTENSLKLLTLAMHEGILSQRDMEAITKDVTQSAINLNFAYGPDAIEGYTHALGGLAAAAKQVGVDTGKATSLMNRLAKSPQDFVVALGADAFHKTPAENMKKLANELDNMKATFSGVPEGMRAAMMEQMYNLDAETVAILEQYKEVEKEQLKWPDRLQKSMDMQDKANMSLSRQIGMIRERFKSFFDYIGAEVMVFVQGGFHKLFSGAGESLVKLQDAVQGFFAKFAGPEVQSARDEMMGFLGKINEWMISLVDRFSEWLKKVDVEKLREGMGKITTALESAFIKIKYHTEELITKFKDWEDPIDDIIGSLKGIHEWVVWIGERWKWIVGIIVALKLAPVIGAFMSVASVVGSIVGGIINIGGGIINIVGGAALLKAALGGAVAYVGFQTGKLIDKVLDMMPTWMQWLNPFGMIRNSVTGIYNVLFGIKEMSNKEITNNMMAGWQKQLDGLQKGTDEYNRKLTEIERREASAKLVLEQRIETDKLRGQFETGAITEEEYYKQWDTVKQKYDDKAREIMKEKGWEESKPEEVQIEEDVTKVTTQAASTDELSAQDESISQIANTADESYTDHHSLQPQSTVIQIDSQSGNEMVGKLGEMNEKLELLNRMCEIMDELVVVDKESLGVHKEISGKIKKSNIGRNTSAASLTSI